MICCAVPNEAAERLGLPFAHDVLEAAGVGVRDHVIPYDRKNRSSFSLWVNHASTFTGITDNDRATTINAIADQVKRALAGEETRFFDEFRLPGHVPILRGADGLLARRCGQTELSLVLAQMAGITPAIVVCEMLDDESGMALRKDGCAGLRRGARDTIPRGARGRGALARPGDLQRLGRTGRSIISRLRPSLGVYALYCPFLSQLHKYEAARWRAGQNQEERSMPTNQPATEQKFRPIRTARRDHAQIDYLVGLLSDDNPGNRWKAAQALGRVQDPAAVEALLQALYDDDWRVQQKAIWALGCDRRFPGDPSAASALH